jgi:predicted metal-dependent hydrolase
VLGVETTGYHPLYLKGIEFFNACEFFESHEAWEELWADEHGPARKFFQGLIQAAVALHHFGNGNLGGAKKLYYGAKGYLEPYRPRYLGLDLDAFLAQFDRCFAELAAAEGTAAHIELVPDLIPEIHLDPAPPAS